MALIGLLVDTISIYPKANVLYLTIARRSSTSLSEAVSLKISCETATTSILVVSPVWPLITFGLIQIVATFVPWWSQQAISYLNDCIILHNNQWHYDLSPHHSHILETSQREWQSLILFKAFPYTQVSAQQLFIVIPILLIVFLLLNISRLWYEFILSFSETGRTHLESDCSLLDEEFHTCLVLRSDISGRLKISEVHENVPVKNL